MCTSSASAGTTVPIPSSTVVSIKPPGEDFTYATADTVIAEGDLLIVAGKTKLAERFAAER